MLDVDHIEAVHHLLGVVHGGQAVGLRLPGLVDVGHAALVANPLQYRRHHKPLGPGLVDEVAAATVDISHGQDLGQGVHPEVQQLHGVSLVGDLHQQPDARLPDQDVLMILLGFLLQKLFQETNNLAKISSEQLKEVNTHPEEDSQWQAQRDALQEGLKKALLRLHKAQAAAAEKAAVADKVASPEPAAAAAGSADFRLIFG